MRKVDFYRTPNGKCLAEEYIDALNGKQAQKVAWVLELIETIDRIPIQYFKKLTNTNEIWEVRIQFGGNIFRLLGFFAENDVFMISHGFTKKTQKTPPHEIEVAEARRNEYLTRRKT